MGERVGCLHYQPLFAAQSSGVVVGVVCALLVLFVGHSAWASSRLYSSPTLLLPSRTPDGDRFYIDDFSEVGPHLRDPLRCSPYCNHALVQAYSWIRHNTAKSSSIGAWWDYGHHIAALGNRPALVSGHTTNATTLATVV